METATTAAFDVQARTSDRRNGPCRVSAPQRTAPGDGKGQGVGSMCTTRRSSGSTHPPGARHAALLSRRPCRSSGARDLTVSSTSGRRGESRGALWSRSSTLCWLSLSSTPPSRRWWTRWWKWWKCPKSPLPVNLAGAVCVSRSRRRNSWWKCRCLPSATASSSRRCRRLSCHGTWMQMAANGATARDQGGFTGGCLAHSIPSGPSPASPGRYFSTAGCGRPCDQAAQVPAVPSSSSWMCLRFSSSTGCCCFQLLHRDRCAQCVPQGSSWVVVDMPGVYNDRCLVVQTVQKTLEVTSCSSSTWGRAGGSCSCKFQQFSVRSKCIFRTPSIWTLSPGFQRTFWGALDDEEFFVVEGSGGGGDAGSQTPRCSATCTN